MSLIEVNINNSFNKKEDKRQEDNFENYPTLDVQKKFLKTDSDTGIGSMTNVFNSDNILFSNKIIKPVEGNYFREIIIGIIGSILGAIIIYLIFGF